MGEQPFTVGDTLGEASADGRFEDAAQRVSTHEPRGDVPNLSGPTEAVSRGQRVAHLSSAHPAGDSRILEKECESLAAAGYEVHLLAQDDPGARSNTVNIRPLQRRSSRGRRMVMSPWIVYRQAVKLDCRVYHFHDPELIGVGLTLQLLHRKKVVYDVHEDLPRQILGKAWLPRWLRRPIAGISELIEVSAARAFSAIVATTPTIAKRFPASKTVLVRNYPRLQGSWPPAPFGAPDLSNGSATSTIIYVGSAISRDRGALEMVQATDLARLVHPDVRLVLGGRFLPESLEEELSGEPGWAAVRYLGWLDRPTMQSLYATSDVGLIIEHPLVNHLDAYPIKLFEYMAAGIPVVVSDFPLWREIVESTGCGLLVDPLDAEDVSAAIVTLLANPSMARAMGERGRAAIGARMNWEGEARALVALYDRLMCDA